MSQFEREQRRMAKVVEQARAQESVAHVLTADGGAKLFCAHCGAETSLTLPKNETARTVEDLRAVRRMLEEMMAFKPLHKDCPVPIRGGVEPGRSIEEVASLGWRDKSTGIAWLVEGVDAKPTLPFTIWVVLRRPDSKEPIRRQVDLLKLEDEFDAETYEQLERHIGVGMKDNELVCGHCDGTEAVRAITKEVFLQRMREFSERHVWCPRKPGTSGARNMADLVYRRKSDGTRWRYQSASAHVQETPFRIRSVHVLAPDGASSVKQILVTDADFGEQFEEVKEQAA